MADLGNDSNSPETKAGRLLNNRRIELLGWTLFTLSALSFVIASIGHFWAMAGSLLFLLACLVFFVPYFREKD